MFTKIATATVFCSVVLLLLCALRTSTSAESVSSTKAIGTIVATSAAVSETTTLFEYVGSNKCKKCHLAEYKSWEKTKKGHALDTLKPGQAKEEKEHAKLDLAKDYSQDAQCVKCHTTGFGQPGGYVIPAAADEKTLKSAEKLAQVGCESCHGPGSAYLPIFEEITKSKRKYKVEELHAAGLTKIEKSTCTTCHNEQSPTFKEFDFDKMKEKRDQIHEKVELKQREG